MRSHFRAFALALLGAACTDPSGIGGAPEFSLQLGGDVRDQLSGLTVILPEQPGAYREYRGTVLTYQRAITPVVLANNGELLTQLSLGLLGEVQEGAYVVRRSGAASAPREFTGELIVSRGDSAYRYWLTSGSLVITSTRPLRATLEGTSTSVTTWARTALGSAQSTAAPAVLRVSAVLGR